MIFGKMFQDHMQSWND